MLYFYDGNKQANTDYNPTSIQTLGSESLDSTFMAHHKANSVHLGSYKASVRRTIWVFIFLSVVCTSVGRSPFRDPVPLALLKQTEIRILPLFLVAVDNTERWLSESKSRMAECTVLTKTAPHPGSQFLSKAFSKVTRLSPSTVYIIQPILSQLCGLHGGCPTHSIKSSGWTARKGSC